MPVAETLFAILKKELLNRRTWPGRLELQSATLEYIEASTTASAGLHPQHALSANYEQLRLSPLGAREQLLEQDTITCTTKPEASGEPGQVQLRRGRFLLKTGSAAFTGALRYR